VSEGKDGASGPRRRSGKHVTPRRKLGEPQGGWGSQDMAAARKPGRTWSQWAGAVLEEAARREVVQPVRGDCEESALPPLTSR
jgi:hypothetical protein